MLVTRKGMAETSHTNSARCFPMFEQTLFSVPRDWMIFLLRGSMHESVFSKKGNNCSNDLERMDKGSVVFIQMVYYFAIKREK